MREAAAAAAAACVFVVGREAAGPAKQFAIAQ